VGVAETLEAVLEIFDLESLVDCYAILCLDPDCEVVLLLQYLLDLFQEDPVP